MPRQTLTKTTAPGGYAAAGVTVTMTAAIVADKEQFVATGKELVIAHNTNVGAQTVTITSAADETGRTKDITTDSLAAGAIRVYGPFPLPGWVQAGTQYIYLQAGHADIKFGVIVLP
jgi:hypothetical protein